MWLYSFGFFFAIPPIKRSFNAIAVNLPGA